MMRNKVCKDKKQVSHRHGSLNDWWGQKQGIFYIPETATDPKGQYPRYKEGLQELLGTSIDPQKGLKAISALRMRNLKDSEGFSETLGNPKKS